MSPNPRPRPRIPPRFRRPFEPRASQVQSPVQNKSRPRPDPSPPRPRKSPGSRIRGDQARLPTKGSLSAPTSDFLWVRRCKSQAGKPRRLPTNKEDQVLRTKLSRYGMATAGAAVGAIMAISPVFAQGTSSNTTTDSSTLLSDILAAAQKANLTAEQIKELLEV